MSTPEKKESKHLAALLKESYIGSAEDSGSSVGMGIGPLFVVIWCNVGKEKSVCDPKSEVT